ncbi:response regulator [Dyella sp. A6]|uniref:response regulator n=1 Tax=Dyella aluminiiresistens TaxID=3069105 RepID=UPI002E77D7AA|nr:response regulator [Dyella sp. A6]
MSDGRCVVIVEDEPKLAALLRDYLAAAGFRSEILADGHAAVERILELAPAAVLLDVMLPGEDGLSICRRLRAASQVPVLLLTARVEEIDRLLGLELGADDYICKPYSPREVVARLRAVLRRVGEQPAQPDGQAARLQIDEERFEARIDGQPVVLTPVEFRLLQRLAAHPGRVYSRGELIDAAYRDHRVVSERTIDSHVKNLRRKLQTSGLDAIGSVYGVGYRLEWPQHGSADA